MATADHLVEMGHMDELTAIFPRRRLMSDPESESPSGSSPMSNSEASAQPRQRRVAVAAVLLVSLILGALALTQWAGQRRPHGLVSSGHGGVVRPEGKNQILGAWPATAFYTAQSQPAPGNSASPSPPPSQGADSAGSSGGGAQGEENTGGGDGGSEGGCWVEPYTNYLGNDLAAPRTGVGSAEACCSLCAEEQQCLAWTWKAAAGGAPSSCQLKGGLPRKTITKVQDLGATSGQPTQVQRSIQASAAPAGESLFCFALMQPYSYEKSLLAWQYSYGYNLFGCDEYAVYSNMTLEVVPGLSSVPVASNLVCASGGEFGTALNTEIFMAVWARVVGDARYEVHDWTVKVDADCVFFPDRLRAILPRHPEDPAAGVYLNNCKRGMHGPVEVLSRRAVEVWWQGAPGCQQHFNQVCSGDCQWGEDMFIDQCMLKVLHVKREYEPQLLLEDHCDPPPNWMSCSDTSIVAFHPFKTPNRYSACVAGR